MPNTVNNSTYGPIHDTTIAKSDIVLAAAAAAGHKVVEIFGYNTSPDHNNKQCIDFMHYGNVAMRNWLVNYLIANAKTLGVEGIISANTAPSVSTGEPRCMGFPHETNPPWLGPYGEWRHYGGPKAHRDHVHVQFDQSPASAPAKPAPPNPLKPSPAKPAGYPTPKSHDVYASKLNPGQQNSDSVWWMQKAFNGVHLKGGADLALDGDYGPAEEAEVRKFQDQECHDPQDGDLGPKQAALLFKVAKINVNLVA